MRKRTGSEGDGRLPPSPLPAKCAHSLHPRSMHWEIAEFWLTSPSSGFVSIFNGLHIKYYPLYASSIYHVSSIWTTAPHHDSQAQQWQRKSRRRSFLLQATLGNKSPSSAAGQMTTRSSYAQIPWSGWRVEQMLRCTRRRSEAPTESVRLARRSISSPKPSSSLSSWEPSKSRSLSPKTISATCSTSWSTRCALLPT